MIVAQVSWLKLSWTIAASIGVLVTFALLYMSVTDYQLLVKRELNGWRKQVAKTSIFIFFGGFMTQAVYLAAGFISLTQPNATSSSQLVKHLTQSLFLFGALGAIVLAIVIFYRRMHILEIIEKHIAEELANAEVNKESDESDSYKDTSLN